MAQQQQPGRKNGGRRTLAPQAATEPASRSPMSNAAAEPRRTEPAANARPTEEEIRRRAYELYLARGQTPGDPTEDWCRAEQELRAERERPHRSSGF